MGAGGIVASAWVSTAQLVPSENRARWSQALSVTWSCSAIAGPLLGGALSGTCLNAVSVLPLRLKMSAIRRWQRSEQPLALGM